MIWFICFYTIQNVNSKIFNSIIIAIINCSLGTKKVANVCKRLLHSISYCIVIINKGDPIYEKTYLSFNDITDYAQYCWLYE